MLEHPGPARRLKPAGYGYKARLRGLKSLSKNIPLTPTLSVIVFEALSKE
jgi:hypothetical protein